MALAQYWPLVMPHLKSWAQFWALPCKKDIKGLKCAQERAKELKKSLESQSLRGG